jgi:putative ABC transport system permease protein
MFKNNIRIAFRNLKNSPFLTSINAMGLIIGITGSLIIALYIIDEMSYDSMFTDAGQIYRINTDVKFGGAAIKTGEASAPMAGAMKNDFPEVEYAVRFRNQGDILFRRSDAVDNTKGNDATFVDPGFFDLFGLELLSGNKETALLKANTLVLTQSVAEKHFNTENAVGQRVLLNNDETYIVTGVMKNLPKNSFLRNHGIFMAMDGNHASKEDLWGSMNYYTFVKLQEGTKPADFQLKVAGMLETYMLPWAQKVFPGMTIESFAASGDYINYQIFPLTDIYLHSDRNAEMSETGSIQNVYILLFIGVFLIFLACVNFMNLSTAHSLKRAKEVGIRKTLGSNKSELIWQFLTESGLITAISMFIAIAIVFLALPYFNDLAGKDISMPIGEPLFWVSILSITLVLGLLSGSYPAFFMSRFKPLDTLKGDLGSKVGGGGIRRALVVFQFSVSVVLIIGTLVVYQQLDFIQNKELGFDKEQVLLVDNAFSAGKRLDAFKDEVEKLSAVQSTTLSSQMPTPSERNSNTYFKIGSTNQEDAMQMQEWVVDHDYLNTLGLELIAGRNFNPSITADAEAVIVNEANLKILNLDVQSAIGSQLAQMDSDNEPKIYKVIGVVKNFHYESMRENIGALALFQKRSTGIMAIKLKTDDYGATLKKIEELWKKEAPGQPFDYSFMDEEFNNTYSADQRLGTVFIIFTSLSIFIACLGLFGLASFNAQKRTKEIGIRKILGASVSQITFKLTVDFLKLVGIATLLGLPLGWYAMNVWLQDFSYRIDVDWKVLTLAALLVIVIAIITVSYQSIKAAIANPIKSLRTE